MLNAKSSKSILIVMDHREARIYRTVLSDSQPARVVSLDPHGSHRYLHNVGDEDNGERKAEYEKFYQAVIAVVLDADRILIFGHGQGASSAMAHLVSDLQNQHPRIAERIIGTQTLDLVHQTEQQLLARARTVFDQYEQKQMQTQAV